MTDKSKLPETVEQYIDNFPGEIKARMERIRAIILDTMPDIQEKISWGMATFFIGGKRMHFAGYKNHIGLYPGTRPIEFLKEELSEYRTSKGGIQLPYGKPLPEELISRIARMVFIEGDTS